MAIWIRPPGPVTPGLRIGLLGGSFNPAHDGHLYVSKIALKALRLDYVWWLVTPGNPLKPVPRSLAARLVRARNVARAPRIIVTGIEAEFRTRYTADSVAALQRRFPGVEFVWLMGSDNLEQFSRWRHWQTIARHVGIAVVRRPGSVLANLHASLTRRIGVARRLGPPPCLVMLDGPRSLESSTELRERTLGAAVDTMLNLVP